MANTLTEFQYLDRDLILKGVCEWIVKESPMIKMLPFKSITGNAYKYNVETSMATASWLGVGDQIHENTSKWEQRETGLYTIIKDGDTDKTQIEQNSTQNPETVDIEAASKSMAHAFETALICGRTTTASNTKEFKGFMRQIAEFESTSTTDLDGINNSQVIDATGGSDGASGALTMTKVDQLIDQIKPGKPDLLLMSKKARRKLNVLQRAAGSQFTITKAEQFGMFMEHYDSIPIQVSDFVPDNIPDGATQVLTISTFDQTKARGTGYDNTIIFALKLGEQDVCGIQSGEMHHEREEFVEGYNVIRNRFWWNVGLACFKKYSLACLININPDT